MGADSRLRSGPQPRSEPSVHGARSRRDNGAQATRKPQARASTSARADRDRCRRGSSGTGRAMAGRRTGASWCWSIAGTTDSSQVNVPPVPEVPPHAVVESTPPTPPDRVAPSLALPDGRAIGTMEPTGARAPTASDSSDLAITANPGAARASPDSITELVVTTEPAGARVTVNGIGWGVAPVRIRHLPAGDKRIRVSKEGYATEERTVHIAEGQQKVLAFQLGGAP